MTKTERKKKKIFFFQKTKKDILHFTRAWSDLLFPLPG